MNEILSLYASDVLFKLDQADIELSDDGENLLSSVGMGYEHWKLDVSARLEDSFYSIAEDFAQTNYPNEFSNPALGVVQILLKDVSRSRYKGLSLDVAVILFEVPVGIPTVLIRITGGSLNLGNGNIFQSGSLESLLEVYNKNAFSIERQLPVVESGEILG